MLAPNKIRRVQMNMRPIMTAFVAAMMLVPAAASADLATIWVKGKGTVLSGTGDVYDNLDGTTGFGAEAGVELLGIDLWGEAVSLGKDQFMYSGNLGWDLSLSLVGLRATVGGDVGVVAFKMLEPEPEVIALPTDVQTGLETAGLPASAVTTLETQLNTEVNSQLGTASRYAAGATARARASRRAAG